MLDAYSSSLLWLVIVSFIISFVLAFGMGANDVSNSFGTSVGSKVLTIYQACTLATIFEILGSILIGDSVSNTIRKGILDVGVYEGQEVELSCGYLSTLIASSTWLMLATYIKLPISGTHSVVASIIGFSLVSKGTIGIRWMKLLSIIGSWFISPVLSGLFSTVVFHIINICILKKEDPIKAVLKSLAFFYGFTVVVNVFSVIHDGPKLFYMDNIPLWLVFILSFGIGLTVMLITQFYIVPIQRKKLNPENGFAVGSIDISIENPAIFDHTQRGKECNNVVRDNKNVSKVFGALQILTAIFGSFTHGGNDISNAMGPLIAVWMIYSEGSVQQNSENSLLVLLYGGLGISAGLWLWGRKVIKTIGEDLTTITPTTGFAIEIGAVFTTLIATKLGIPISTTHCKVGSIVFVGCYSVSEAGVDWKLFRNIILAWLVTLPMSAGISALVMVGLRYII